MRLLVVSIIMLFSAISFADVTIVEESDGSKLITYFSKHLSAHYIDGQLTNITDVKKASITVLNPISKTYFQATFAEMKSLANQMKIIEPTPGEQEPIAQTQPVSVVEKGKSSIAGFECDLFELTSPNDQSSATICLSGTVARLIAKEANFSAAEKLMDALDNEEGIDSLSEKISQMERRGYLMQESVNMLGGGFSTVVTSVSKENVSDSVFNVPSDYQRITLGQAMGRY